jgi:precorrin-6B methylase 1
LRRQQNTPSQNWEKKGGQSIKVAMPQGKDVALLEVGDPTVFGSWYWLLDYFQPEEIVVIPAVSAFNAANVALKQDAADLEEAANRVKGNFPGWIYPGKSLGHHP